ncbi:MAG: hypothetical protein ACOCZ6_05200 [Nanoarchaeota archaeon]
MTEKKEDIISEFQNKHYYCLKDINFIIKNSFGEKTSDVVETMIRNIKFYDSFISSIKKQSNFNKDRMGRLILNAWYHEAKLNYPSDSNERIKFVGWQIITFYYTIYSALSCVVRSSNQKLFGHDYMINFFTNNFIKTSKCQNPFFKEPFNVYIKEDKSIHNKVDQKVKIEYCMNIAYSLYKKRYEKNPKKLSLFHYFKFLREWANYQNPFLFIELYGSTLKHVTDNCLLNISNCFLSYVEIYYLKFLGWEEYERLFKEFETKMTNNLKVKTPSSQRFLIYEKNKTIIFSNQTRLTF